MTLNTVQSDIWLSYFNRNKALFDIISDKNPVQKAPRLTFYTGLMPVFHHLNAKTPFYQYWNIIRTLAIVLECLILQVP